MLALGLVLGVAGASFAVALPLASRWYPPRYQGVALGIAGAGNSGTVLAALFAPALAAAFGWTNVIGLAAIPLTIALVVYVLCAKDSPNPPAAKSLTDYAKVLRQPDAWLFMFYYAVTFGGFSGLASSLSIYFNTQYRLDAVSAGYCTAACVFAGSLVRPIGGAISDRLGGVRVLSVALCGRRRGAGRGQLRRRLVRLRRRRAARRDAGARHGQRRRVPARAAALRRRDRA